ncbi:hypothetical protein P9695_14800 [Weizmannia sp. CD-2023]|uniref:hypothetical protein n=1 Tax=Heyndrickxia TaxID=2837504 RepID=UPI002E251086|nr:hypothetical protein [Weizmannia sp. CD-2023]MED4899766.1 hypothetical protein [Weizmannia sp. CD-2023]
MKTLEINKLAADVANGIEGAYEKLFDMVDPLLKAHARKGYAGIGFEDLLQEFRIISYNMTFTFVERYQNEETSYMALVYTACENFRKNTYKANHRIKRSKFFETSLNAELNDATSDDKSKTLEENVSDIHKNSIEEQVVGNITGADIMNLLEHYRSISTQRDYEILKSYANGASNEDVAHIVNKYARKPKPTEEVEYDQNTRKVVSRARKAFREFLEEFL